nr:hypothetical protein [Niallia taxi]
MHSGTQLIDSNEYGLSNDEKAGTSSEETVDTDNQKNSVKQWVKQFQTFTITTQTTISITRVAEGKQWTGLF